MDPEVQCGLVRCQKLPAPLKSQSFPFFTRIFSTNAIEIHKADAHSNSNCKHFDEFPALNQTMFRHFEIKMWNYKYVHKFNWINLTFSHKFSYTKKHLEWCPTEWYSSLWNVTNEIRSSCSKWSALEFLSLFNRFYFYCAVSNSIVLYMLAIICLVKWNDAMWMWMPGMRHC